MDTSSVFTLVFAAVAISLLLLLVFREVVAWYFKVSTRILLLQSIDQSLNEIVGWHKTYANQLDKIIDALEVDQHTDSATPTTEERTKGS